MKNIILKFRDGLIIGLGIITVLGITHAAVTLTASENEPLTSVKWNNLVDKISGINTDKITGNVGIGTESPLEKLHIKDGRQYIETNQDLKLIMKDSSGTQEWGLNLPGDQNLKIHDRTNNSNVMTFEKGTGNIGIGTGTPGAKLQVIGDILSNKTIGVTNGGTPNGQSIYSPAPNEFGISSNGVERIRIKSDGNIGIGTDSPKDGNGNATLHVDGTTRSQYFAIHGTIDTNSNCILFVRNACYSGSAKIMEDNGVSLCMDCNSTF